MYMASKVAILAALLTFQSKTAVGPSVRAKSESMLRSESRLDRSVFQARCLKAAEAARIKHVLVRNAMRVP